MNTPTPPSRAFALVRELGPFRALLVANAQQDSEVVAILERTINQARCLAAGSLA
jgi:hypothetical protein